MTYSECRLGQHCTKDQAKVQCVMGMRTFSSYFAMAPLRVMVTSDMLHALQTMSLKKKSHNKKASERTQWLRTHRSHPEDPSLTPNTPH